MKRHLFRLVLPAVLAAALVTSCTKDWLEPSQNSSIDANRDIKDIAALQGALHGVYDLLSDEEYYGRNYIIYGELRGDNCGVNGMSGRFIAEGTSNIVETNTTILGTWVKMYKVVASCNAIIALENANIDGEAADKQSVVGQAYGIRALAHFDLLKLFGGMHVAGNTDPGIPYVLEFKGTNSKPARTAPEEVKRLLYADLDKAIEMLDGDKPEKVYFSKWAAYAEKARVAQWFEDWTMVKEATEAVVNSGKYNIVKKAEYVASWKKKLNQNSIFEIAYSESDNIGLECLANIYNGDSYGDVVCTPELKNCFEPSDVRGGVEMIDTNRLLLESSEGSLPYYVANLGKFTRWQVGDDNIPVIRYEEVILMRAEALMNLGNAADALTALNSIANERGATPYTVANLDNILLERQREFCFEGLRFDDLSRARKDVPPCSIYKKISKQSPEYGDKLFSYPVPLRERQANPNITQIPGY